MAVSLLRPLHLHDAPPSLRLILHWEASATTTSDGAISGFNLGLTLLPATLPPPTTYPTLHSSDSRSGRVSHLPIVHICKCHFVELIRNASPRTGVLHWMTPRRLAAQCLVGTSLHKSRGNTQHAAPEPMVASISFDTFNRSPVSTRLLDVADVLHTSFLDLGHPVTKFEFGQLHDVLHDPSNFSNFHSTRHDLRHF